MLTTAPTLLPPPAASFGLGLVVGIAVSRGDAALAAAYAVRKYVALERRTSRAERLGELGMLTAGLAHEIKNPLSTLQLNLQLLRENLDDRVEKLAPIADPDAEERRKVLGRMQRRLDGVTKEAGRLREILDGFLRYAGRIEPERRRVDLRELCVELTDFLQPQAAVGRVRLQLGTGGGDAVAEVDENLVRQALLNLTLNAIQHTPAGGAVTLALDAGDDDEVVLRVSDTGKGVPPDELPRLYDPYFTRRKGGTGLGLAITRRIAEAHGGRVSASNREAGDGAIFALTLPRRAPDEA